MNKVMELKEAVQLIPSGCMLALGGSTLYRRPLAFVRALIERFQQSGEPGKLTLMAFTAGLESDLLVGAGLIERCAHAICGNLRPGAMFTYTANHGLLEIWQRRGQPGIWAAPKWLAWAPCLDVAGWAPTCPVARMCAGHRPYGGADGFFPLSARLGCNPLRADPDGNAQIGEHHGVDAELPIAPIR
jgi:hypothetical protein